MPVAPFSSVVRISISLVTNNLIKTIFVRIIKTRLSAVILATALFATATFASSLTTKRQARYTPRRLAPAETGATEGNSSPAHQSRTHEILYLNETAHTAVSTNWAGAVLIGSGYTAVTGQFTVPTLRVPRGREKSGTYSASAWVGIDGDTWSDEILQTGVDFTITNGEVSYTAWYEWWPDYAYDFSITISAGDVIKLTVTAASESSGTAVIENITTGESISHIFSSGSTQRSLGKVNAEWIVEDYEIDSSLVDFANFGTIIFTEAQATDNGSEVGPSGATLIDILNSQFSHVNLRLPQTLLTSSSVTSDSVKVSYVEL